MGVAQYTPLTTLNQQAVITKYSTDLRRGAILRDIYTNVQGEHIVYEGQRLTIPNGIYTKISPKDTAGANNVRVIFKLPINAPILRANAVAMGTEIPPIIRSATIYRNNYRIVVQDEPGYHEHRLDASPYNLYAEHVRDLSPHARAYEGLEIRMALLESNGWTLMAGSTVNVCPAQWNRNFFILGCPLTQQPVFHPVYATYTNRIVSSIDIAAGGDGTGSSGFRQSITQMLSGNGLDTILRWGLARRMTPLMVAGRSAYYLSISGLCAQRFSDPGFSDSMGQRWTVAGQIANDQIQKWTGLLGVWKSAIGADVYVVVDERLATLIPSGSAPPFGLAPGYTWPTDDDLRNLDNPLIRDAAILHGAGAIVNLEPEKMHMIHQDWDYDVRNGAGYAGNRGIQQLQFDMSPADPTGAARQYAGSAIIVMGRSEP